MPGIVGPLAGGELAEVDLVNFFDDAVGEYDENISCDDIMKGRK